MKLFRSLTLLGIFILSASILLACSGAAPTPIPPTTAPTAAPTVVPPTVALTLAPTTAPTVAPPTVAPTTTTAPIIAPTATVGSSSGGGESPVQTAFTTFADATTFRIKGRTEVTPLFFAMPYTPGPNDDPNKVLLFALEGEVKQPAQHFTIEGIMASFVGALSGFDPNTSKLEIANVDGKMYMRGTLEGATAPKWYLVPADGGGPSFAPKDLIETMSGADYAANSFAKTGAATIGAQTCDVYTGNRAAFDAALPRLSQSAALNGDELDPAKITRAEFLVTVCPDKRLYRIQYSFDAPAKTKPDTKGTVTYDVQLSGYDDAITIQAPADAVPMPGASTSPTSAPEATATKPAPGSFANLDGEWEGASSTDSPLQFTVADNKITYANLNYAINTGSCSASGAYGTSIDDGAITDEKFTVALTNSDGVKFTFAGTFTSNAEAAGTLNIKGNTFCGDVDAKTTWTATHVASPDSPAPEPTIAVEPTQAAGAETPEAGQDGAALVNALVTALNAGKVDDAAAFFGDDSIVTFGSDVLMGATNIRTAFQLLVGAGAKFTVSDVNDLGGLVSFKLQVTGPNAGTYANSSAIIEEGKISVLTIK